MKKKILSLALALALVLALVPVVAADTVSNNPFGKIALGGDYAIAIKADGSLWAWGWDSSWSETDETEIITLHEPTRIGTDTNWASVSAGAFDAFAIKTDGSLWLFVWRDDWDAPPVRTLTRIGTDTNWASVSVRYAIKVDGSLWDLSDNEPVRVGTDNNWASVSAGSHHTAALKTDGSLWAWGWNYSGQLGNGTTDSAEPWQTDPEPGRIGTDTNWSSVAVDTHSTYAVKTDGSLWVWGRNGTGRVGTEQWVGVTGNGERNNGTIAIGIRADGSLWSFTFDWGSAELIHTRIGTDNDWTSAAVNLWGIYAVAVKTDGSVWGSAYDWESGGLTLPVLIMSGTPTNPIDSASGWARGGITEAIAKGFVPADIQDNYQSVITRAEFCRMAVMWLEYRFGASITLLLAERGIPERMNRSFSDTDDPYILAAYRLGVTAGSVGPTDDKPGEFNPNGQFTRQEAATMIMYTCKAAGFDVANPPTADFKDMGSVADWAKPGVNFVKDNGIMAGDGTNFNPAETYSRQHSIITFNNIQ